LCGNKSVGKDCFLLLFRYYFGLALDDRAVVNGKRSALALSSQTRMKRHAEELAFLKSSDSNRESSSLPS
jgi:hypothetical protein